MHWDRTTLPWLVDAPVDFRARCKAISSDAPNLAPEMRALASYRLNANQLSTLAGVLRRLRVSGADLSPLRPLKIALLGNGSHELIVDALMATCIRHGINLEVVNIPFNSIESVVLNSESELHLARPDAVLLNFTYHAFLLDSDPAFSDEAKHATQVEEGLRRIHSLVAGIQAGSGATVFLNTIAPPSQSLFGSIDRSMPGTPLAILDEINKKIAEAAQSPVILLDLAKLAESVGLDNWNDESQWHAFKLPFSQRLVPLYADHVASSLAAFKGLSRKCLVLDLDNTLWGGVIGDDGLSGIRLGNGFPDGEAFLDVQRTAKSLRHRGIVLAVSSKNTDQVAREAFRSHPDMLLSEADIAVFQANWSDKASNLEAIAEKLSIGVDALVFLDDNPAERELVRQKLPQVSVPELPDDPALFSRTLLAGGYFDVVSYSSEDKGRAASYAARAAAAELKVSAVDLDSYLKSLDMRTTCTEFDAIGRSRIAQLINKSNQFNLTSRRYTESDIEAIERDSQFLTLQVRLKDRFADHGMIAVCICRMLADHNWEIDTWLMSCRVLGRRVEEATLAELVTRIRTRNGRTLIGSFVPSGRNQMVAEHYAKLGFEFIEKLGDTTTWGLDLASYISPTLPIAFSEG